MRQATLRYFIERPNVYVNGNIYKSKPDRKTTHFTYNKKRIFEVDEDTKLYRANEGVCRPSIFNAFVEYYEKKGYRRI